MMNTAKIIDLPVVGKEPITHNAAWAFNLDNTHNWAYWENAFTPEECKKIIDIGNKKISKEAVVIGDRKDVRDSKVTWLYSMDDMGWAFRRVTDITTAINDQFFQFDLFGMIEGFQFTRYDAPNGRYGMHIDKYFGGSIRKLSLTIQLSSSEDYEGGDLLLQTADIPDVMPTEQGKLIAFPSYVLHEVKPVTKGTRYSLVAWITGKPFKQEL